MKTAPNTKTTFQSGMQAPLELLGSNRGVSVIDPGTILTRLWYFDGKFLSASGFRLDQQYVRSLVALSNQANGTGVVHGLDARRGSGDQIDVDGGLALAPSGRVVYLPQQTSLSISQLIARSDGDTFDPAKAAAVGTADFRLCRPDEPVGPDQVTAAGEFWLLTAAAAEALCGEEERFGQLCESACATETDRSVAVEGVLFRVHRLALDLPTSTRVPSDGVHQRSRVASAFFEAERHRIGSRINGPGIRSSIWCEGADGIGGEEVPLAVFNRSGGVTSWLDMWTARREIMETTPQRYWGFRFAMRPLDVFLAQVLQFQCQLLALGDSGPVGGGDPCADERDALLAANSVLAELLGARDGAGSGGTPDLEIEQPARGPGGIGIRADLPIATAFEKRAVQQLAELNVLIGNALIGKAPSATGSALIDGGIVETPSGGYLPVDPNRSVEAQVHAFFGPGVDLRFCAVRPDFIPEALQAAQHMERISLIRGIDNPDDLEEVDVLVPGARFDEVVPIGTDAFEGTLRILPDAAGSNEPLFEIQTFARDHEGDEWSWSAIAFTGLGDEFDPKTLQTILASRIAAMRGTDGPIERDGATEGMPPTVRIIADSVERNPSEDEVAEALSLLRAPGRGARRFDAARELRLIARRREALRLRLERAAAARAAAEEEAAAPRAPLADRFVRGEIDLREGDAALYGWLDFRIGADLTTLVVGDQVSATAGAVAYGEIGDRTAFADLEFSGTLKVTDIRSVAIGGGTRVTTALGGGVTYLIDNGGDVDSGFADGAGITVEWIVGTAADGRKRVRAVAVRQTDSEGGDGQILLDFAESGSPRQVEGRLVVIPAKKPDTTGGARDLNLADVALREDDGVLDPGTTGRDLSEGVLRILDAQLAGRGRRPGFAAEAGARLFALAGAGGTASTISTTTDWVMFHRRRTTVCSGASGGTKPTARRRYRWYHAETDDPRIGARLRLALSQITDPAVRAALFERLDFTLISTVEFEEQRSELLTSTVALRADLQRLAPDTDVLLAATMAESPTGDGDAVARARAIATVDAVAPIVDTANVQIAVKPGIPPEYQSAGLDGVLFTLGTGPGEKPAPTVAARVVRVSEAVIDRLESIQGAVDEQELFRIFEALGAEAIQTTVHFQGTQLIDKDALAVLGVQGPPPVPLRLAFATSFVGSATAAERGAWPNERTPVISEALGDPGATTAKVLAATVDLADAQAVIFIVA